MNIVCAGFGGQGVLTAGLILGHSAVNEGQNVTWLPVYGSEMRGGFASSNLKISEKRIASPYIRNNDIDILIVMNSDALNSLEYQVKSGGMIIYNSSMIKNHDFRKDVEVYEVKATDIANKLENSRASNIVMLGALAKTEAVLNKEIIGNGIFKFFDEKGKNNPKNEICYKAGFEKCQKVG